jgi:hypothetical protein
LENQLLQDILDTRQAMREKQMRWVVLGVCDSQGYLCANVGKIFAIRIIIIKSFQRKLFLTPLFI